MYFFVLDTLPPRYCVILCHYYVSFFHVFSLSSIISNVSFKSKQIFL